ncbi:MAG: Spermidine/putrescine-binding periplasmic protein, partial [Bacillota bacterium]|nr:Spermidine/putrescine-binding periplasmic protein [Bacillota bacterium]
LSDEFRNSPDYHEKLAELMNDTSPGTMAKAEPILREIRQNVYSFETESGKADMVTGKVVANLQWSGDGAYTLDQAEADDYYLKFAVPKECTNLWFDGWVMLKSGIKGDAEKQQAAEAFINFLSRPDNVVRNMYYVGYTSVISGGEDSQIFDYVDYCYGAEEGDTIRYPLGYFFSGDDSDEDYVITAPVDQAQRQLFAQYPPLEVFDRSSVMRYFPDDVNAQLNQMWINVRCFNFDQVSGQNWLKVILVLCLVGLVIAALRFRHIIFRRPVKRGFYRSD